MPTKIYDISYIKTIYGKSIEVSPLKIKHMREFMSKFDSIKTAQDEDQIIGILTECATIAMKQFYPEVDTVEKFEDNFDLKTMYKVVEYAGGIKMENEEPEELENTEEQPEQAEGSSKSGWEDLDLNKLESEAFLLGIWKNYDELESSICLAELMAILEQKREMDYQDKKFTASLKGIDLDDATGQKEEDPWEAMKARVAAKASGIGNGNPNDVTSLQGVKAQQAGFGIGNGLDYEVLNESQ
jgi:hypothetical protein